MCVGCQMQPPKMSKCVKLYFFIINLGVICNFLYTVLFKNFRNMSFHVVIHKSKRKWSNDDLFCSLTQTTTFSTDFEKLHKKRTKTLNQIDAAIELLGYFLDSTVMP